MIHQMRKLLLAAFFTLAAIALQAQTVTKDQLQGKWRLIMFNDDSGSIDIVKGTWKIKDNVEDKDAVEEQYNNIVLQAQDAILTIKDNMAAQVVGGQEYKGVFTLQEKDGKTYIKIDEGTTGVPQVFFKDGKMHLDDQGMEMVYEPVK